MEHPPPLWGTCADTGECEEGGGTWWRAGCVPLMPGISAGENGVAWVNVAFWVLESEVQIPFSLRSAGQGRPSQFSSSSIASAAHRLGQHGQLRLFAFLNDSVSLSFLLFLNDDISLQLYIVLCRHVSFFYWGTSCRGTTPVFYKRVSAAVFILSLFSYKDQ